jgi:hypothetical protein
LEKYKEENKNDFMKKKTMTDTSIQNNCHVKKTEIIWTKHIPFRV